MAEIFYTVSSELHRMARLENGRVVEMDFEIPGRPPSLLGGVFLGRVIEIHKPLKAAFVDVGLSEPGLLPLREHQLPPLQHGNRVLVQVSRTANPLEKKGVRLTRMVTLSRGPLLYTPSRPGLNLSKRLKEREAFLSMLKLIPGEGVVVRHWANPTSDLINCLEELREDWKTIVEKENESPPFCVFPPQDLLTRILQTLGTSDHFVIDDFPLVARTDGLATYSREKVFDELCEEVWESLFSPEIVLPQGGNLYIEETHGVVVIDVNSQGDFRSPLLFNRKALQEVLRQIQLRDLGGKIVVDLISPPKTVQPLLQKISLPSDTEIWGISPMGLLELTRRKRRLSLPRRLQLKIN